MPKKNYTISSNQGKNKTRADEKANINGTKYRYSTPSRQYKKATEDAKAAFLMQTGYNKQRSNYDIVNPMKRIKQEIKGQSSYNQSFGKGPAVEHVDKFDGRKKKLGYQGVGDGYVGGTKNNKSAAVPNGRMRTSESLGKAKGSGDYTKMDTSDSSQTIWGKGDRYRDSSGGKHVKKAKGSSYRKNNKSAKGIVTGGSTGKRKSKGL